MHLARVEGGVASTSIVVPLIKSKFQPNPNEVSAVTTLVHNSYP